MDIEKRQLVIVVTGAQGVGKSSFCQKLFGRISDQTELTVELLDGLGDKVKASGVPVGSHSTADTIAAIFAAHIERERLAKSTVVLQDRCLVDALAYLRLLKLTTPAQTELCEEIAKALVPRITLIIHLTLSPTFEKTTATHETPELRISMAALIPQIISEFDVAVLNIDASESGAVEEAMARISSLTETFCKGSALACT